MNKGLRFKQNGESDKGVQTAWLSLNGIGADFDSDVNQSTWALERANQCTNSKEVAQYAASALETEGRIKQKIAAVRQRFKELQESANAAKRELQQL